MPNVRQDLDGLGGYYLVPLRPGSKRPRSDAWQTLRLTSSDRRILDHRGNVGLLLGPVYPDGAGWLELDVDDPEGLVAVLPAVESAGLTPDGIVRSGGRHSGWKLLYWLSAAGFALHWSRIATVAGLAIEVRTSGQAAIPPTVPSDDYRGDGADQVLRPYAWHRPAPPLPDLQERATARGPDWIGRLRSCLYGEAGAAATAESASPLPLDLAGDLGQLVGLLTAQGHTFGNQRGRGRHRDDKGNPDPVQGIRRTPDGGIECVVLYRCPFCGGMDGDSRGRRTFKAGLAHVTPSLRLKCKRATCKAGGDGLDVREWLFDVCPDAASSFLRARSERPDPRTGDTLQEAQELLRGRLADCLNLDGEIAAGEVLILDYPTGAGKTWTLADAAGSLASLGQPFALFTRRHDLIAELARKVVEAAGRLPRRPDGFEVVSLRGRGQLCKRYGERMDRVYRYSGADPCRQCSDKPVCGYWLQWEAVGRPYTVTIAPMEMAARVLERHPKDTIAVFDELPDYLDRVDFPEADLRAVEAAAYRPGSVRVRPENFDLWYNRRSDLARVGCEVLAASKPHFAPQPFGQAVTLAGRLSAELRQELARAADYDPREGRHPSLEPGELGEGREPEAGRHIRRDFDDLRAAVLALCEGRENLTDGVLAAYLNAGGTAGLRLVRRCLPVPDDRPVLILAAAARYLESANAVAWHPRKVRIERFDVAENPAAVTRLWIEHKAFSRSNLRKHPGQAVGALLNVCRFLLPELAAFGARFRRWPLSLGIAAPSELCTMLERKHGPAGEALAMLVALGCKVTWKHYGNLDGSNAFEHCDAYLTIGDDLPSLSDADLDAYALGKGSTGLTDGIPRSGREYHKALATYHRAQNEGRARAIRRTTKTPLLLVHIGRECDWFDARIDPAGAGKSTGSALAEAAGRAMLEVHGWSCAPVLAEILTGENDGSPACFLGFRISPPGGTVPLLAGLLSALHCLLRSNAKTPSFLDLPRTIDRLAKLPGVTERRVPNPDRTGSWRVLEARVGAYDCRPAPQSSGASCEVEAVAARVTPAVRGMALDPFDSVRTCAVAAACG